MAAKASSVEEGVIIMQLTDYFDCVIMLTWSNWKTELRSNRYHYVSRFTKELPVIFVQQHPAKCLTLERGDLENFYIINAPDSFSLEDFNEFSNILNLLNVKKPLCWVYNSNTYKWIKELSTYCVVYHATEAYLSKDCPFGFINDKVGYRNLIETLKLTDLMISVSEGVEEGYLEADVLKGQHIVIANGCDYNFYCPSEVELNQLPQKRANRNRVLYQGTIYNKIDYALLLEVIKQMPNWEFIFCGRVAFNEKQWHDVLNKTNVQYLGILPVNEVKQQMLAANVGLIPFTSADFLVERSLPLKSFEYLACGVPTVSTPIKALLTYKDAFLFANDIEQFKSQIIQAAELSTNIDYIKSIMAVAKLQDYDTKYLQATNKILEIMRDKS